MTGHFIDAIANTHEIGTGGAIKPAMFRMELFAKVGDGMRG
jgi:hypothetical protein